MTVRGRPAGAGDWPDAPATGARSIPVGEFSVETLPAVRGEIVVLRAAGEVDLDTQASLESALARCLDPCPRYLVVDLSAVTFCAVRGLCLVGDAAVRATVGTTRFAVSGLSAHLDRVAAMLWEPGTPARYRSIAAAVTAMRAEQAQHDEATPD